MQAPVSAHSSRTAATPAVGRHPDCWGLSLGPRHPSIRSPAVLLYNYYYAIIVHSVRLPTGSAGCWRRADRGWLGLALGWFASCELSSGQGDGRGAALQRGGAGHHQGNLRAPLAPNDRHRSQAPWRFGWTHLGFLASALPSEAALLAGTGGCAPCGGRAGTGRVGGRYPLRPRAGAAGWPWGRHISVCTCVPVCLHLGVRACIFSSVLPQHCATLGNGRAAPWVQGLSELGPVLTHWHCRGAPPPQRKHRDHKWVGGAVL